MLAQAAIATLVTLAVAAAACAGDDGGTITATPTGTATAPPVVTLPPIDAWIVYRDGEGNIVARDLQSQDLYKQTVDFNEEVIVQAECSKDGSRIGYLIQNFDETFRRITIRGEGAPADFIQVPASVQGFTWSPDGSQIAIGEWDQAAKVATVSLVDVATGEITEVATADRLAAGLDWSPDGSRIAYYLQDLAAGKATVEVRGLETGEARRPIESEEFQWLDPAWTPDGQALIVTGLSPTGAQLYRVDVTSGELTQVSQDPTIYRRGPQFSPDGRLIAFTGSIIAPAVSEVVMALHSFGIFTMNPDGSGEAPVTVDPRTNPGFIDTYLDAYLLGWCKSGPWLDDLWVQEEASQ